ncbi:hypothetical protein PVOR_15249 [Paenibacillus vortex V453]|uniref:Uncharacterized protein n=1 Tax=Paenibacillus vortex V453 TaxID=715225 RepID=A0A2R9SUJ2_9BACL|nr:hypothetical protein [Paenibacillus vortex]EFU41001.1 hypothetical protein PVOR_15249 [Paenibacillus vortex V453]
MNTGTLYEILLRAMKFLKNKKLKISAAYYYLGLAIGLIKRDQVIDWADDCLEKYEVPYELIELSLSQEKGLDEILSLLKLIYNKFELRTPLLIIHYEIRLKYLKNEITKDQLFSYISSLLIQGSAIGDDEETLKLLDIIEDRYYLASQGIYGNEEEVIESTLEELRIFEKAYSDFSELLKEE